MADRKRGPWKLSMAAILIMAAVAVALLVVAWAWVDAGRRPLRTIVEPVRPQVGVVLGGGGQARPPRADLALG